ncbi:transglutaminase domain-containing protein [Flavicella sediminum]|uniref:transglutaminase domain-containing protein n=1 Tax=Flavicella sediminum TaxID=2585141 RepID=UPI001120A001|nr:transglutaminase domain-containing protein [Flavicella sediminum]
MKKSLLLIALLLFCLQNVFPKAIKFGKVSKNELSEKYYPLDSTADAAYLYKHRSTYFEFNENRGSFDIITEHHFKIKIYSKDGFNRANTLISYYNPSGAYHESVSSIKGYTYNLVNGKIKKDKLEKNNIFDEKENKYWSRIKLTMPNIKEGCIIEIKYTLSSPYNDIKDLQFQSGIPIKQLHYHTSIPEYYNYNKQNYGYYFITPVITSKSSSINWTVKYRSSGTVTTTSYQEQTLDFNTEEATYEANNIPAISSSEPYISSIRNYFGGMKYELATRKFPNSGLEQFSNTWEAIAKKIHKSPSFGDQLKKHSHFKNDLEEILATCTTENEKIQKIFKHVKKKIKWNNYTGKYTQLGVKKAYTEGTGNVADINLTLISMLKEAGLNTYPVLLSTRDNGIPIFPTTDGINYVIAAVRTKQGDYSLLDATEKYSSINNLPKRILNWEGKIISKTGGFQSIPLTPKKHALESSIMMISFDDDLEAKGTLRTTYSNLYNLEYRKRYSRMKEEKLMTTFEKKYPIEIEKIKVSNKTNLLKPISQTTQFTSSDIIESMNGKIYLNPLFFLATTKNPFKLEDRKYPVDYATPWKKLHRITIDLPTGYKIESLPKSFGFGLSDGLGVFKYQVVESANKIQVLSSIQMNQAVILPKYYQELKNLYKEMIAKQSEKIVLIKE